MTENMFPFDTALIEGRCRTSFSRFFMTLCFRSHGPDKLLLLFIVSCYCYGGR